jgi:hypothetical protein
MSFNFLDSGNNICKIKNEDDEIIISVSNDKSGLKELTTKDKDHIQPIPDKTKERSIVYCSGKSGSGKSYFTMKYVKEYQKQHPKYDVILFTSISSDAGSLDKIKGLKKMKLDDTFLNYKELENIDNYKDCMIIFDDTDCISEKRMKAKLSSILGKILETGRHTNTSCIYTSHLACKGSETKTILNEAHLIVYFPDGTPPRIINNLLENYVGLSKNQIKEVDKIESRWIAFYHMAPCVLMWEHGIKMVKSI